MQIPTSYSHQPTILLPHHPFARFNIIIFFAILILYVRVFVCCSLRFKKKTKWKPQTRWLRSASPLGMPSPSWPSSTWWTVCGAIWCLRSDFVVLQIYIKLFVQLVPKCIWEKSVSAIVWFPFPRRWSHCDWIVVFWMKNDFFKDVIIMRCGWWFFVHSGFWSQIVDRVIWISILNDSELNIILRRERRIILF